MKNLLFELLVHFVYQCLHSKTISSAALDKLVGMIEDIEDQTDKIVLRENEESQESEESIQPAPAVFQTPSQNTTRIYGPQECAKLDQHCRSLLMHLEQVGVLDHTSRETIIDKVMSYEDHQISLETLKWAILSVLNQEPCSEKDELWIKNIMAFDMNEQSVH